MFQFLIFPLTITSYRLALEKSREFTVKLHKINKIISNFLEELVSRTPEPWFIVAYPYRAATNLCKADTFLQNRFSLRYS